MMFRRSCACAMLIAAGLAPGSVQAQSDAGGAGPPAQPERLPNGDIRLGGITLERAERRVVFPAVLWHPDSDIIEVLISTPVGRLHESLLRADVNPLHLQVLLHLLGLNNGPRLPDAEGRQGDILDVDLEWRDAEGKTHREPVEKWVLDTRTGREMPRCGWAFVGSAVIEGAFQAEVQGNLILTYSCADTILDIADVAGDDDTIFVLNRAKVQPGPGAKVQVILTPRRTEP